MEWTQVSEDHWVATGRDGTAWEVVPWAGRYGCIVAQWGKPDWYADSLEAAKALCEEIDARPPIPREQMVEEEPPRDLDF